MSATKVPDEKPRFVWHFVKPHDNPNKPVLTKREQIKSNIKRLNELNQDLQNFMKKIRG